MMNTSNMSYANCNYAELVSSFILHFITTIIVSVKIIVTAIRHVLCHMSHLSATDMMSVCHVIVGKSKTILVFIFNHIFSLFSELIFKCVHNVHNVHNVRNMCATCTYNPLRQCSP